MKITEANRSLTKDFEEKGIGIHVNGGGIFRILNPDPKLINPEMLANSLSKLCRWTGHCKAFFSVAQHSVLVSKIVPQEFAMQGLLHDASEAFIGDISRPLKVIMEELAPGVLKDVEETIQAAVAERFLQDFPWAPEVHEADTVSLATEKRDILDVTTAWVGLPKPLEETLKPLGPRGAKTQWLKRFYQLGGR